MVTMEGPTQYLSPQHIQEVNYLHVNELEPVEFYCEFIRHDSDHTKYIYQVYVDRINPSINPKRYRDFLRNSGPLTPSGTSASITNTEITNNSTNNMTIYKTQIIFLSVDLDTPTLIIKCAVDYFPNGMDSATRTNCSSSSTFAIIPNSTCIITPTPTSTCNPISTTDHEPTTMNETISLSSSPIITPEAGSIVGVLCSIVMIETTLIIIFIIYQFVKHKKSQGTNNKVVPMTPSPASDTDSEIYTNTIISESPNNRQKISLPNSPDSDSAMGTVSTVSIGNANIAH